MRACSRTPDLIFALCDSPRAEGQITSSPVLDANLVFIFYLTGFYSCKFIDLL